MWRVVKILIWVIITMWAIDFGFELISMPNTFVNILGLLFLIVYGCISYKTKCLTSIKILKQNEKE